jgi:hypothetical protein
MRLGDSDVVRIALIPREGGYVAELEYADHEIETTEVEVPYLPGLALSAVGRLDSAGFDVAPDPEQIQALARGQPAVFRWTIWPRSAGSHRVRMTLSLQWEGPALGAAVERSRLWEGGFELQVGAPLGLSAPDARRIGILGLLLGGVLVYPLAELNTRRKLDQIRGRRLRHLRPNPALVLEGAAAPRLEREEADLLRAVFARFEKVNVEHEYSSGYSGARTWLLQPIRHDGRTEAHTIVKIGPRDQVQAEYANYTAFVKHTLPPMTARVQDTPVCLRGGSRAALQYTFVGSPAHAPVSLREFALTKPAAETGNLIARQLFETFGPTWWLQRKPYAFSLRTEYDRLLPVELVLEPHQGPLDENVLELAEGNIGEFQPGQVLRLRGANVLEVRPGRRTITLGWKSQNREDLHRVRVSAIESGHLEAGDRLAAFTGVVLARRRDLLEAEVRDMFPSFRPNQGVIEIAGRRYPNPLNAYENLLRQRIQGTSAVIHGDLNLENILIGPGELMWLIDFAGTREGHTLMDFVRLEVELVTQVCAERFHADRVGVDAFVQALEWTETGRSNGVGVVESTAQLLTAVRGVARRCLRDPEDLSELWMALGLAYLGALKFDSLNELASAPLPKTLAFTASAYALHMLERAE